MCDNNSVFKVGDNAVYPSHGLVKVVSIEEKSIGDQTLKLLILQVVDSDTDANNGIRIKFWTGLVGASQGSRTRTS